MRKFVPPLINFESNRFFDMVDLDSAEKTEPPVTKDLPVGVGDKSNFSITIIFR